MQTSLFGYCLLVAMCETNEIQARAIYCQTVQFESLFIVKSLKQVVFELWAHK